MGADVFRYVNGETRERYVHLMPPDFNVNVLATFEFQKLARDGGVELVRQRLLVGIDILATKGWTPARVWPPEVEQK